MQGGKGLRAPMDWAGILVAALGGGGITAVLTFIINWRKGTHEGRSAAYSDATTAASTAMQTIDEVLKKYNSLFDDYNSLVRKHQKLSDELMETRRELQEEIGKREELERKLDKLLALAGDSGGAGYAPA